jgi:hypothetical protein
MEVYAGFAEHTDIERLDPEVAGRPDLMSGRTSLTLYDGMTGMLENAFIDVKNRSKTITAELEIPAGGARGVVLAQAGRIAHTNPIMFSADEAAEVGIDEGTPVTEAYTAAGSRFSGRILKVTVEVE